MAALDSQGRLDRAEEGSQPIEGQGASPSESRKQKRARSQARHHDWIRIQAMTPSQLLGEQEGQLRWKMSSQRQEAARGGS